MRYGPQLWAVLIGAGLTVQIGLNTIASNRVGSPILASVLNFCVGLIALIAIAAVGGARNAPGSVAAVPVWAWLGGLLGAGYVAGTIVLGPRLGAAALLALTLVGQLATALLVDHYGWIGFPRNPVSWDRTLGIALLLAGAWLVMRR